MAKMVVCIICLALSVGAFTISCLQFKETGYLFNNYYFWASQAERQEMSKEQKKPHYRQSGVIFLFVGILFLIMAVQIATEWLWTYFAFIFVLIVTIVYAVASSVKIEKQQRKS